MCSFFVEYFELEHLNELGDICRKKLIVEIMGKHSNLIFCQEDNTILDSIKHISANMSSVREVLPGRTWFIPHTQDKKDPLTITEEEFFDFVCTKPMAAAKAIYTSLTGFSPLMAEEVCCRAGIDGGFAVNALEENAKLHLFRTFSYLIEDIKNGAFTPNIVYQGDEPKEFSALKLTQYQDLREETYDSISGVLETYYAMKNRITRIRQKSSDLRRVVNTALERNVKKYDLQQKQLKDTDKREKYRIYGELLNTYGYSCQPGDTSLKAVNYYNGENHDPAHRTIQTVRDTDKDVTGLAILLLQPCLQHLRERLIARLVALHDLTAGLIYRYNMIILVNNLHITCSYRRQPE